MSKILRAYFRNQNKKKVKVKVLINIGPKMLSLRVIAP